MAVQLPSRALVDEPHTRPTDSEPGQSQPEVSLSDEEVEEVEVLGRYRARLSPGQFAWLARGLGVIRDVPADFMPARTTDYEADAADR
jgi:hypothetical protein